MKETKYEPFCNMECELNDENIKPRKKKEKKRQKINHM